MIYPKAFAVLLLAVTIALFAACTGETPPPPDRSAGTAASEDAVAPAEQGVSPSQSSESQETLESGETAGGELPDLEIRFGNGGRPFTLYLYDNDTAVEIARTVGQTDWNLPIYNYDDFEGWEYMQYYDIPSRYNIPSTPEAVTSAKAGEVYYSEPNRIILFYHDAEISGSYSRVGYIDGTDEFISAVEDNPVLEGWGNKIVSITRAG